MVAPLAGRRVLDLGALCVQRPHALAASMAAKLCAAYGAEVVRPLPAGGEPFASLPPLLPGGGSALDRFLNAGKRTAGAEGRFDAAIGDSAALATHAGDVTAAGAALGLPAGRGSADERARAAGALRPARHRGRAVGAAGAACRAPGSLCGGALRLHGAAGGAQGRRRGCGRCFALRCRGLAELEGGGGGDGAGQRAGAWRGAQFLAHGAGSGRACGAGLPGQGLAGAARHGRRSPAEGGTLRYRRRAPGQPGGPQRDPVSLVRGADAGPRSLRWHRPGGCRSGR